MHRGLGLGFEEVIYQRAMEMELMAAGLDPSREVWIDVHYRNEVIGRKRVDFVVGDVMVEIKALSQMESVDFFQALS